MITKTKGKFVKSISDPEVELGSKNGLLMGTKEEPAGFVDLLDEPSNNDERKILNTIAKKFGDRKPEELSNEELVRLKTYKIQLIKTIIGSFPEYISYQIAEKEKDYISLKNSIQKNYNDIENIDKIIADRAKALPDDKIKKEEPERIKIEKQLRQKEGIPDDEIFEAVKGLANNTESNVKNIKVLESLKSKTPTAGTPVYTDNSCSIRQ